MTEVYYITNDGKKNLEDELNERLTVLRKQISEQIATAKDQGDLSENFEYQDAKERQAQNETRIIQIKDMLSRSVIVEKQENSDEIMIGSVFLVKMADGTEREFSLVGSTEASPLEGKISNESPLGQAFLGHAAGDKVDIELPAGTVTYTVLEIR